MYAHCQHTVNITSRRTLLIVFLYSRQLQNVCVHVMPNIVCKVLYCIHDAQWQAVAVIIAFLTSYSIEIVRYRKKNLEINLIFITL